jgi:hypothetical protein
MVMVAVATVAESVVEEGPGAVAVGVVETVEVAWEAAAWAAAWVRAVAVTAVRTVARVGEYSRPRSNRH